MFKAWHKIIAAPLAATSIGVTAYLINLWQNPSILDSTMEERPETKEIEPVHPEPDQGREEEEQEGNVNEQAQKKPQEKNSNAKTQGNKGKDSETTDDTQNKTVKNDDKKQDSKKTSSAMEKSKIQPSAISNKGSDNDIINERAVEKEIKKLIDKVILEKNNWITKTYTLKNTYQIHELMDIGNKLLQQINRVQKT